MIMARAWAKGTKRGFFLLWWYDTSNLIHFVVRLGHLYV